MKIHGACAVQTFMFDAVKITEVKLVYSDHVKVDHSVGYTRPFQSYIQCFWMPLYCYDVHPSINGLNPIIVEKPAGIKFNL